MLARFVTHRTVYLLGLAGLLFGMAMSEFAISVAQFLLAANWLISANFKLKWGRITSNPAVWVIWIFYLLHFIGLVHTAHYDFAIDDLRIKLPLLLIPLFVVSEKRLSSAEMKGLLSIFVLALIISTGFGFFHHVQHQLDVGYNVRYSSVFVPHIRLSLMTDLAIVWLVSEIVIGDEKSWIKLIASLVVFYLLLYLVQLQALTGLVILPFALFFAFLFIKIKSRLISRFRFFGAAFGGVFLIVFSVYIYQTAKPFIDFKRPVIAELEENTANGNRYLHEQDNLMLENGNQVWIYISDPETRPEWNKRSDLDFDGVGKTGESIRATLYRYLSSKGVRKDAVGMQILTTEDVLAVENGEANHRFVGKSSIEKRIYQTIWELSNYQNNAGSFEGHSVAMRLEFWKMGWQAFLRSPIFGNGTGDVRAVMSEEYTKNSTILSEGSQLKPHNQFITTGVSLGLIGLCSLLYCFLYVIKKGDLQPVEVAFIVILLLSFISEDTIEGQVGATLFAGIYALFFCQPKIESEKLP